MWAYCKENIKGRMVIEMSEMKNAGRENSKAWPKIKEKAKQLSVLGALIVICIAATILSPKFATVNNIVNVMRQISMNGIVALGMTFVCLTGGVDLSVGSIVGLSGVTMATLMSTGVGPAIALPVALLMGLVMGFLNGLGIVVGKLPPFIMTLGSSTALRGLTLIISKGYPINWRNTPFNIKFIGQGYIFGIPVPVYIYVILFLIGFYVLKYTHFGHSVYAIGDNREAARLNGINVKKTEWICFMITGLAAAISAIVLTAKLSAADPNNGDGYELTALSMVYMGGVSTSGGTGSILGTLLGAMLIGVLSNVQNMLGISPYVQKLVEGLIVIAAVLLSTTLTKKEKN